MLGAGNDADEGTDLDTFIGRYRKLVKGLACSGRRIVVSGLLHRRSVDLKPYEDRLNMLCSELGIEHVSNYDNFMFAFGEMPAMYFLKDKLHLAREGTRKLLLNIDSVHSVLVSPNVQANIHVPSDQRNGRQFRRNVQQPASNGFRHVGSMYSNTTRRTHTALPGYGHKYCYVCERTGHSTQECWFNTRSRNVSFMQ